MTHDENGAADAVRRALDGQPLANRAQVADHLGVGRPAVSKRLARGTMPEPVAHDARGEPLWLLGQFA